MSYPEEMQKSPQGMKKKTWCTVAVIVLFILALPVLVPLALAVAGGLLAIGIAVAGGILALLVGFLGCLAGGILVLLALLACGVVGTGVGIVLLFSAPASGMAVLGASLMAAGAGVLGSLLVWAIFLLIFKGCRAIASRIGRGISKGRNRKQRAREESAEKTESMAEETAQAGEVDHEK